MVFTLFRTCIWDSAVIWPWPAAKVHVVAVSPLPSLIWGGEWKEKGKKLMGRDKVSLTKQQMKWTVTTIILIRRIYKTNSEMHRAALTTWHTACSWAMINFPPPSSPTQHSAWWHTVLNTLFHLGSLGQPVSTPSFWWKLALSWPNSGQRVLWSPVMLKKKISYI